MGMEIVAFTARPRTTPESKRDDGFIVPGTLGDRDGSLPVAWHSGVDKASLHAFLGADLDYVLIALPLTASTRRILGAEEFAVLGRRNAFVLNVSRGESIDHDALIAALKKPLEEGGLRGAALDVTSPEPLPKESELWGLENVAITPHVSAWNGRYFERALGVLAENLERDGRGEALVNVVDRKRGY
jgi:phosphoglycerate dehydrogenase-like enzyme